MRTGGIERDVGIRVDDSSEAIIAVGRVGRVFGVRGWLHVTSSMDPPETLLDYSSWYLQSRDAWALSAIEYSEARPNGLVVKFVGVDDREAARAFTGANIGVDRDALPGLDEDEFYWCDLLGADVVGSDGTVFGVLSRFLETGANDVMVCNTASCETLIPFVMHEVVKDVDVAGRCVTVDWSVDWLDKERTENAE